ncbi:unnamed protein product, partial [Tetraodon nigroviridis]
SILPSQFTCFEKGKKRSKHARFQPLCFTLFIYPSHDPLGPSAPVDLRPRLSVCGQNGDGALVSPACHQVVVFSKQRGEIKNANLCFQLRKWTLASAYLGTTGALYIPEGRDQRLTRSH